MPRFPRRYRAIDVLMAAGAIGSFVIMMLSVRDGFVASAIMGAGLVILSLYYLIRQRGE